MHVQTATFAKFPLLPPPVQHLPTSPQRVARRPRNIPRRKLRGRSFRRGSELMHHLVTVAGSGRMGRVATKMFLFLAEDTISLLSLCSVFFVCFE